MTHSKAAPPPIRRIVDEGLLIAISAVRMAVKNAIIVGALREHSDYDPARYARAAQHELHVLARQNEEYGKRVRGLRKVLARSGRVHLLTEDERADISQFALRRRVHKKLALALDAVAADDAQVARIVEDARQAASAEIRDAVSARLIRLAIDRRDPDYEDRRAERIEVFRLVNLALLEAAHSARNGTAHNEY